MKDGGPAFPQHLWGWCENEQKMVCEGILPGMTLRDYFAGQVLPTIPIETDLNGLYSYDRTAQRAYLMADAMIKERNK